MTNVKTLRKRIALVAATALGVGLLVATPAFAASSSPAISALTSASVTVGSAASATTTMAFTASAVSDTGTLSAALTTKPAASGATAAGVTFGTATTLVNSTSFVSSTGVLTATAAAATSALVPVNFTPDVPGAYVVTLTNTAGTTATQTFNITATLTGAMFLTTGNTPAPVASTVTSGSSLSAITGGFVKFAFITGNTSAGTTYNVTVANGTVGTAVASTPSNLTNNNGSTTAAGVLWAPAAITETLVVQVYNSGSATSTITVQPISSGGVPGTAMTGTVTWSGSSSLLVSAATSTVYKSAGIATPTSVTDAVDVVSPRAAQTAAANAAANILVVPKDANSNVLSTETLTATISGPGLLGIGTLQAGASATQRAVVGTAGQYFINVFGDGTAGVSTITISDGSTVLRTKTVTFTGPIATLAATQVSAIYMVGANAGAVTVLAKDAAGNALPSVTVYASSGTTAVATIPAAAVTSSTGIATFPLTGIVSGSSVITFGDAATAPAASATATVMVALSTASTITLTLDKATYAPGAKAVLTLTAKDANGNLMADGTYALLTSAGLVSSTAISGLPVPSTSITLSGGVAIWTLFAPLVAGPFSVNATTAVAGGPVNTGAASMALVAAASVVTSTTVDPGTAANAAAIAALQASVTLLSTTVASLVAAITAQIRALSALIKKAMAKKKVVVKKRR
jgi:hypothetical protein